MTLARLHRLLGLVCFVTIAAGVVTIGGARADVGADWPMYMYDNGHTGFNPSETTITTASVGGLQQQWQVGQDQNTISAQPVVANGKVYWGTWDGNEHASDASTGAELWKTYIGDETKNDCSPSHIGVGSTATIATATIGGQQRLVAFVGGGDGSYYALDANDGSVLWKHNFGSPQDGYFMWSSPTLYNGSVYVGVASIGDCPLVPGQLVKLDAATGATQAVFDTVPSGCIGGGIWSSVTVDAASGYLYTTTGTSGTCSSAEPLAQAILQLRASDLSLVASWKPPPAEQVADGDFGASPTLFTATINGQQRQLVGAANKNSLYYAFDRGNIGTGPVWESGRISSDQSLVASSAWDGSRLYVGGYSATVNGTSCSGVMRAIDPSTGAFVWSDCFQSGEVTEGVTAVPGVVLAGVGADLVAVNSRDGSVLFDYTDHSGWWFYAPPTVAHGVVYAGQSNGKLYAFKPASGTATVPAAPVLTTTAQNANVHLSWTTPNDGGSPITGYRIYRGTTSGAETLLTSLSGATNVYDDGTVSNGQTYYYQVTAVNNVGESAFSAEQVAHPQATVPAAPVLSASTGNATVHLSWTVPNDGGSNLTGYRVYRATSAGTETLLTSVGAGTTSYDDNSVVNGKTYFYEVSAVNGVGEGPRSTEVSTTPSGSLPGAPVLSASAGNGTVHLSWTVPSSASPITGYRVYRGTKSGNERFVALVNPGTATYDDNSVSNGQTYYYEVTAINSVGESKRSNEVAATPQPPPPGSPTALSAVTSSSKGVQLSWLAPNGSTVTAYYVYRADATTTGCSSTFAKVDSVSSTSYKDVGTKHGSYYCYEVTAVNSAGESTPSNAAGPVKAA